MKAVKIEWDTDGEVVELPDTVDIPDNIDIDDVADYLSDEYGFCITSLQIK